MNNKLTLILFFVFIFSLSFVTAQGLEVPHQFYGTATYNSVASTGMTVETFIDGVSVGTTTTLNGQYGYSPLFLIKDNDKEYMGKTINFYLNGVSTRQTAIFKGGVSTKLDLSATGTTTPPTNNGGGGSSSGGGGSPIIKKNTSDDVETTNQITNNQEDENSGLLSIDELNEETNQDIQQNVLSKITGAVVGGGKAKYTVPLIFIVLIFLIALVSYTKKKPAEVEESEEVVENSEKK